MTCIVLGIPYMKTVAATTLRRAAVVAAFIASPSANSHWLRLAPIVI
jgi:hypothetical protein